MRWCHKSLNVRLSGSDMGTSTQNMSKVFECCSLHASSPVSIWRASLPSTKAAVIIHPYRRRRTSIFFQPMWKIPSVCLAETSLGRHCHVRYLDGNGNPVKCTIPCNVLTDITQSNVPTWYGESVKKFKKSHPNIRLNTRVMIELIRVMSNL